MLYLLDIHTYIIIYIHIFICSNGCFLVSGLYGVLKVAAWWFLLPHLTGHLLPSIQSPNWQYISSIFWEVHRSERREFARSERRLFTRSDRLHVKDFVTLARVHAKTKQTCRLLWWPHTQGSIMPSIMTCFLLGRCSIWWCWRVTLVAHRIVMTFHLWPGSWQGWHLLLTAWQMMYRLLTASSHVPAPKT